MKKRKILIVGGLAAGPSAAAKARRVNPNADVTMFEAGETVSYGLCEAPYAIGGLIPDERKLVIYSPERLREEKGIEVKTQHVVENIFPTKHTIAVRNLSQRTVIEYEYDKLILATGASSRKLNMAGEDARNVFHVRSREDTLNILKYITDESPKSAVIIGGGYIGMEMAEALRTRGIDVTILHRHRLPLGGLEEGTREKILEELQNNGVRFVTNAVIEGMNLTPGNTVKHVITNRGTFEADMVILSIGISPNVELAKNAKIRLGVTGAIATDERQQTNIEDIYAAGDCAEVKNIVTGKPMYIPLATLASRAGWVAGENAAGGRASFKGAIRAIAVKVFGLEIAQVGISSSEAKEAGFDVIIESITASSKVGLMPGSQKIVITLIVDSRSSRVIGANVFGGDGAVLRANTIGVAIQHKLTLDDIAQWDIIYSPPFAPLWDPILIAANKARKR